MLNSYVLFISAGTMVNFAVLAREHWMHILVPMGFVIGWYLDKQQDNKLTAFRNKSALYSRYETFKLHVLMVNYPLQ